MIMNQLITIQVFLFPFSAVNAGRIQNGWKLERKLKILKGFHLLKDFSSMSEPGSKRILKLKFLLLKFNKINKNN